MLASKRLPLGSLIELCRVLRHYLGAGLQLLDVFKQQASKGKPTIRPVAGRIALELQQGHSLQHALKQEKDSFPPLFLSLASVGEDTGMLPEVFADLEKFFITQQKLRREFVKRITWPVIQLILAILTLAGLILILGMLPQQPNQPPYDPLGLGLFGLKGASIFLGVILGFAAAVAGGYYLLRRLLAERGWIDSVLLAIPALGPCLRTLALARFCLALRLTTETGMSIMEAVRLSLRATGNKAFIAGSGKAQAALRSGRELTAALAVCEVFPEDFLMVLTVAEESGRLNEVLRHQSDHYDEESVRRLSTLTGVAGYVVWILIGLVIIFAIFRLFSSYVGKFSEF